MLRLQPQESRNGGCARDHEGFASPYGVGTGLPVGDAGGRLDAHAAYHGRSAGVRTPASASDRSVLFTSGVCNFSAVCWGVSTIDDKRVAASIVSGVLRRPVPENEQLRVYTVLNTQDKHCFVGLARRMNRCGL